MSPNQSTLFDLPHYSAVRRSDPRTAKRAAVVNPDRKAEQWKLLLRRLHDGPITADTAGLVIDRHRSAAMFGGTS
jgi:hypothetical protein